MTVTNVITTAGAVAMGACPTLAVPKTRWYPANVPPARPGWYERAYGGINGDAIGCWDPDLTPFDYWTGKAWGRGIVDSRTGHAGYWIPTEGAGVDLPWRGVDGNPSHFTGIGWGWPDEVPPTIELRRDLSTVPSSFYAADGSPPITVGAALSADLAVAVTDHIDAMEAAEHHVPIADVGEVWVTREGALVLITSTTLGGQRPIVACFNIDQPGLGHCCYLLPDGRAVTSGPHHNDLMRRANHHEVELGRSITEPWREHIHEGDTEEVHLRVPAEVAGCIALDPQGAQAHLKAEADKALDAIIAGKPEFERQRVGFKEVHFGMAVIVVLSALYLLAKYVIWP